MENCVGKPARPIPAVCASKLQPNVEVVCLCSVPSRAMLCHAVPEHSVAKPGKSGEAQQFPVAKHWTPSDNSFAIRNFANANDAFPLCSPRISSFFTPSRHCFNAWHVPNRLGIWCQGLARAFQVPFLGHAKLNEVQQ